MWIKLILAGFKNEILRKLNIQKKPSVINYSLTNTCNCECIMCNIWQETHRCQNELTAEEIQKIFSTDFYQSVRHIGISGGEPFIREDIVEVVESITIGLKNLKSLSFISNGTLEKRILEALPYIIDICREKNIEFGISFSLDGIGTKHDEIRGHKNAFNKLESLLNTLDSKGINYSFSTTIIKQNIDSLFEILNYAEERGKTVNFRIASRIDRLCNDKLQSNFEFTMEERYKIVKFLEGVMVKYEKRTSKKLFYFSLNKQLINNSKRTSGCLWQNQGISLDPEGNMHYCFVNSPKIGNIRKENSHSIYRSNKSVLRIINNKYCNSCHHDYGGFDKPQLIIDYIKFSLKKICKYIIFSKFVSVISLLFTPALKHKKSNIKFKNNAYITGWYGTETLGDKAILAGIIKVLQQINRESHFTISSYVSYHTEETMFSIPTKSFKIIGKSFFEKVIAIKDSEIVILGGGPLMDILDVNDVLFEYMIAKLLNKKTIVFGAGLGPIKDPKLSIIIKRILQLSDVTVLRDEKGSLKYSELLNGVEFKSIIDPSVVYLRDNKDKELYQDDYVLMCIREWPSVYCDTNTNYSEVKENFENSLIDIINTLINKGEKVLLFPMHTYYIGDDDRYFFSKLSKKIHSEKLLIYNRDYSMNEGINVFLSAKAVIGMRFHSVVFGNSLGKPTLALDYDTNRGKIFGFVSLINNLDSYTNIKEINTKNLIETYDEILKRHDNKKLEIFDILDNKVDELYSYISKNI